MAETLRDLVVSLSLESSNFSRNIKSVNAMIKEAQSAFNLAKAGVEGFENTAAGAASKLSTLTSTLEKQKEIVHQYEGMLEQARLRLENSVATGERLKGALEGNNTSLTSARQQYAQLGEVLNATAAAFGTESEDYKAAKAEYDECGKRVSELAQQHNRLSEQLNNNARTCQTNADAVTRTSTSLNNAKAAVAETQAAIDGLNKELSPAQQAWKSYSDTIAQAQLQLGASGDNIRLAEAQFQSFAATTNAVPGSVEYLTERLGTLKQVLGEQNQQVQSCGQILEAARGQLDILSSDVSTTNEAWYAANAAVTQAQIAYTNAQTAVANTQKQIDAVNQALSPAVQAWNSYQTAMDNATRVAANADATVALLSSAFQRFAAESGAAPQSVQYLTEALSTQEAILTAQEQKLAALGDVLNGARGQLALLSNDVNATSQQWLAAHTAVLKAETEYNNMATAIAGTRGKIADLKGELTDEAQQWRAQEDAIRKSGDAIASIDKSMAMLDSSYRLFMATTTAAANSLESLYGKMKQLETAYTLQSEAVRQYEQALNAAKAQLALAMQSGDPNKIRQATDAVHEAQTALNNAKAELAGIGSSLEETRAKVEEMNTSLYAFSQAMDGVSDALVNVGEQMYSVGIRLNNYLTRPISDFAKSSVEASTTFESAFTTVRQTTAATEEQYVEIAQAAKDMSEVLGISAASIADTMAEAGRLGVQAENIIEFTNVVEKMSMTFGLTATDAATSVARFMNVMGTDSDQITNYGSAVTYLANNYATTANEIIQMSQGLAGAAKTVGMSEADILGVSTALTSVGITAGRGASTFSQALIKIQTAVDTGNDKLAEFASVAGMSAEEFAAAWRADPTATFTQFILGLASMDEQTRSSISALQDCGISTIRLTDSMLRITSNTENFVGAIRDANTAWVTNTELETTAGKRIETTATQIANFQNNLENLKTTIGDDLKPVLISILNVGNNFINWLDGMDKGTRTLIETIGGAAAALGPVLIGIGLFTKGIGLGVAAIKTATVAIAGFVSGGGLLTLGVAALAAAVIAGTVAFTDWITGARAARDAAGELKDSVRELKEEGFEGIYETATPNMLAAFGMSADSFAQTEADTGTWFERLMEVWTDGAKETDDILRSFTEEFTQGTDEVRGTIDGQKGLLSGLGVLDEPTLAQMEKDMATLDSIDDEVTGLLKKRQNGFITADEQKRLEALLALRDEIARRWGGTGDAQGYDGIQQQLAADIEMANSLGEKLDPSRYGEALVAISQGYQAVCDSLEADYQTQYAEIMKIQDAQVRNAALEALNAQYAQERAKAAEEYRQQLAETAQQTVKDNGLDSSLQTLTTLSETLETIRQSTDDPTAGSISAVTDWVNGMGTEGMEQLQSLYSLILQLQGAGMENADIAATLGISEEELTGVLTTLNSIKEIAGGTDSLAGLAELFETLDANAGEVLELTLGVNVDEAAAQIQTFIDGYADTSVNLSVALDTLTGEAIAAWEAANSGVELTGPMATVGLTLGEDAASTIQSAWNSNKLAVYGADGLPLEITPEILAMITDKDVCAYGEDGTLHVIITPEIGTPEYVEVAQESAEQPQTGLFGIDIGSTGEQVGKIQEDVEKYNAAMEEYAAATKRAEEATDLTTKDTETQNANAWLESASRAMDDLSQDVNALTDQDLASIAQQIMAIYAALQNPELDTTTKADLEAQLQSLLGVVEQIDATQSGSFLSEGIAEGMVAYGWAGDASTLAANISGAVNSALGIASPSTRMKPTGGFVSAGIAAGMSEYSFAGAAATVSSGILSSFSGVQGRMNGIGLNLMNGLAAGIRAGRSGVVSAMVQAVQAAIKQAKSAAQIKSPSRVMRDEVGTMLMKGMGVGISREAKSAAKAMANATKYTIDSARTSVAGNTTNNKTYNQQSTVNLSIDGVSVRSDTDIRSLAVEIAALTKRRNALHGA